MELQLAFPYPEITVIEDLGNGVAAVFERVFDQAGLAVLDLVHGRRFFGRRFDVGETIVVIDRSHMKRALFTSRERVIVLDRLRVLSADRIALFRDLLLSGGLLSGK